MIASSPPSALSAVVLAATRTARAAAARVDGHDGARRNAALAVASDRQRAWERAEAEQALAARRLALVPEQRDRSAGRPHAEGLRAPHRRDPEPPPVAPTGSAVMPAGG